MKKALKVLERVVMSSIRWFRGPVLLSALLAVVFVVAGCGQGASAEQGTSEETSESASEDSGTTSESGEGTSAESGSGLSGVDAAYSKAQEEIEEAGGEKTAGGYRVGYIVEDAEGWWEGEAGSLRWRDPASDETNHIEILPYDKETGLLVPYMDVRLTVLDESGDAVDRHELNFYWSEFLHYANNFSIPEGGTYTLRAELSPPDFNRHGSESGKGKVFTEPVTVEFEGVEIGK